MSFSYANPTSGPSAGGIGWFDFGGLSMVPGDSVSGLTGTLNDGNIVTFDMSLSLVSGVPRRFTASSLPTYPLAQFGVAGYTGLSGNVAMYAVLDDGNTSVSAFTISNITVKDPMNNPIPNYTVLIGDGESTNLFEGIKGQTNGESWTLFTVVGTGGSPNLTGTGTQTFDIVGTQQFGQVVSYVLATQEPDRLVITLTDVDPFRTRQAFVIGFAVTRLTLQKDIGQRIDPSDQFILNITGNPTDQVATTGAANGIQSEFARVYLSPGNTFRINEGMAAGSVSSLTDYTQTLSASNATPAGTVPPVGNLPILFTSALGDDVTYTVLNAAPETFEKTVDKAYANVGEILTYTVTVRNPNDFPLTNVLVSDATPIGTTYIGNLTVSAPFTGTDPASGITVTTIAAASYVVLTWKVQVNSLPPISNPIPNYANVSVPGGNSGMTNVVTTQVNTAFVSILKMVDKVYAEVGDILTYTLTLNNAGNVPANHLIIKDAVPAGTTLVSGSVVGASGTPPTLLLAEPLAPGGKATVSFQVQINSVVNNNPIPNNATINYTYTVNPFIPDGIAGTRKSNTVKTFVSSANLVISKDVDHTVASLGDTLVYRIFVKNIGNVSANSVVIHDSIPNGTTYVANSLTVSVPATGMMPSIYLTNPVLPGEIITILFRVKITELPILNPINNQADVEFVYTVDPSNPNGKSGRANSNIVKTLVFRYNFEQETTDIIQSTALEEAALAAIANAEGAKIQRAVSMSNASAEELLCMNKSVADMADSMSILERILKQKLEVLDCRINGTSCK